MRQYVALVLGVSQVQSTNHPALRESIRPIIDPSELGQGLKHSHLGNSLNEQSLLANRARLVHALASHHVIIDARTQLAACSAM